MNATQGEQGALAELADAIAASGLDRARVIRGGDGLRWRRLGLRVAAGLTLMLGAGAVHASHVNYGLRAAPATGEAAARRCAPPLRIDLHVERPGAGLPPGNLQAAARELRYDAAERLRRRSGSTAIVTGHTRTDLAETALYRLAASPGSRALLGLAPRNGRVVRPLLGLDRERVRELAATAGLPFADDETNDDPTFARNRIRAEVLPGAARGQPRRRAQHRRDAGRARRGGGAARARRARGARPMPAPAPARWRSRPRALAGWEPGLRRLALRALAERAAGPAGGAGPPRAPPRSSAWPPSPRAARSSSAAASSRSASPGLVRFRAAAVDAAPAPVALGLPGRAASARWEVRAELHPGPVEPGGP